MYPNEYINFLVHFHGDRDYFECHEILEEFWKDTDPGNKDSVWVGLILMSVSCYHHRRGNFSGAAKTLEKAISIFESEPRKIRQLGLNSQDLILMLNSRLSDIKEGHVYRSINLPIMDSALLQTCVKTTEGKGEIWGKESDMTNRSLIHRHHMRDRSEIVAERLRALNKRLC